MGYCKLIMVGRLTKDPQLSHLPSGTPVCEIGLAVNNRWRDKDGNQREDVCFIDCRCFGKQAETLNQYMSKGRQLLVEGRLELDQWETPEGQKRSKHRVMIQSFQFLDGQQDGEKPRAAQPQAAQPQALPDNFPPVPSNTYKPPPAGQDEPGGPGGEPIPF